MSAAVTSPRLRERLRLCAEQRRAALVAYLTFGDPDVRTSVDLVLGARYRIDDKWAAYTGMVHLGAAATDNPIDRGQSNAATFNTLGVSYDYNRNLRLNGVVGMVNYAKRGLAPTSMPSHSAFTGIDSRVRSRGNWFGAGATFTF